MTPEINQIKEELKTLTPEELKEIQQNVQNKIEAWKQDATLSDDELKDLSDLNGDKSISDAEKWLNNYIQKLDNIQQQIDFLLALVEIKTENTIWQKTFEIAQNTANLANWNLKDLRDMWIDAANKEFLRIKDKDSEQVKKLKEIWLKATNEDILLNIKQIIEEIEEIDLLIKPEIIDKWNNASEKNYREDPYIKDKLEKIDNIILVISSINDDKNIWNIDLNIEQELKLIQILKYDIAYSAWKSDQIKNKAWENIFNKELSEESLKNLTLNEAVSMYNYIEQNIDEIDSKWIRVWENSISSLDNMFEISNFQEILLKKISEKIQEKEKNENKNYELVSIEWSMIKVISSNKNNTENKTVTENNDKPKDKTKKKEWLFETINWESQIEKRNREINEKSNTTKKNILEKFRKIDNDNIDIILINQLCFLLEWSLLSKEDINKIKDFSDKNPINLLVINPSLLNLFLTNNVKINFSNYLQLSINKDFIENVDFEILLNKILKEKIESNNLETEEVIFLEKIIWWFWGNKELIIEKLWFIKNNIEFKNLFNLIKKSPTLMELKKVLDEENYKEELNKINNSIIVKNLEDVINKDNDKHTNTKKFIIENIKENQDLITSYIIKNINSWWKEEQNANIIFKIIIENKDIFTELDTENVNQIYYWPQNINTTIMLLDSMDSDKEKANIARFLPRDIKNNDTYIEYIIKNIHFYDDSDNQASVFINLDWDIWRTYDILWKIYDNNKSGSFIESWILTKQELEFLIIFTFRNIKDSDKIKTVIWRKIYEEIFTNWNAVNLWSNELREIVGIKNNENEKFGNNVINDKIKNDIKNYPLLKDIPEDNKEKIVNIIIQSKSNTIDRDIMEISKLIFKWDNLSEEEKENQRRMLNDILSIIKQNNENNIEENNNKLNNLWIDRKFNDEFNNFLNSNLQNEIEEIRKQNQELSNEQLRNKAINLLTEKFLENNKQLLEEKFNDSWYKWTYEEYKAEVINKLIERNELISFDKEINLRKENIDKYYEFIRSWYKWDFVSYANENKIPLKNENWEIINAKEISNTANKNFIIDNWIVYSNSSGIKIDTIKWVMRDWNGNEIKLSQNEINLIKTNKEAAWNIINLYESLNKVWLSKLWNLRENIFKSIENTFNISFERNDWDFLSEREIKIMFNSILVSIWEKAIRTDISFDNFINNFENINWRQVLWAEKQVNNYWDTKIESLFIEKFIPRWNLLWFKQIEFENSIRKNT